MILEIILFVVKELSHKVSQYLKDKNNSEHQLFKLELDYSQLQTRHDAVIEELKTSIQYSKHEEKMKALERLVFSNFFFFFFFFDVTLFQLYFPSNTYVTENIFKAKFQDVFVSKNFIHQ